MNLPQNISLTVLLILLLANSLDAQDFKGKIIAGINSSQIEGDRLKGYNKPGLVLGIGAAFPINSEWSIEPELLYAQKGSRSSQNEQALNGKIETIALTYIDLPIIVNYKLREDLVLQAGLSPNYLIGAEIDPGTNIGFQNARSQFRDYDICISGGAEYIAWETIGLNIRWNYSLLPFNLVEDNSNLNLINNPLYGFTGMFNNYLQFSVRYYVNL